MLEQIETWLKGDRDYDTGLSLLKALNASKFIINLLSDGPDAFNTPRLLIELEKYHKKALDQQVIVTRDPETNELQISMDYAAPEPAPVPVAGNYVPDHNLEKKLRIDAKIKQLWKEITHLHGQLGLLSEGQKLFECSKAIRQKDEKIRDLRDHLEYFKRTGNWFDELPENQHHEFDPKDPVQLEREIKNQMSCRSKAAAQLKRPLAVGSRQYHQERFNKFDQQVNYLKTLRNGQ